MPQETKPEPFVDIQTAADFLGLQVTALRKWREKGRMPFPCYNIGRRLGFRLSEVSAWAETRAFGNAVEARAPVISQTMLRDPSPAPMAAPSNAAP